MSATLRIIRLFALFYMFILFACSERVSTVDWSKADVDPVRQSIQKNQVKSYYSFFHGKNHEGEKFTYKSDSANYSEHGYEMSFFQLDDFLGGTMILNKYDSLNRLIEKVIRSDYGSHYLFEYESVDDHLGVVKMYEINRNDTVLFVRTVHVFSEVEKRLEAKIEYLNNSTDTLDYEIYHYEDTRLFQIDGRRRTINFIYNDSHMLTQINKVFHYLKDIALPHEIDHISTRTGLIDSTTINEFDMVKYYHYEYWK